MQQQYNHLGKLIHVNNISSKNDKKYRVNNNINKIYKKKAAVITGIHEAWGHRYDNNINIFIEIKRSYILISIH